MAETGKKATHTCIAKARLTATVLFPTPPLQELTATICSTLARPHALAGSRGEIGFLALALTLVLYHEVSCTRFRSRKGRYSHIITSTLGCDAPRLFPHNGRPTKAF